MNLRRTALATLVLLAAAATASAGEFAVLKQEITAARAALVSMVTNREKRGLPQQKLVKDTAEVVSAHLARMRAPEGRLAEFQQLKDTWKAFKATREEELVPAILANDIDKFTRLGAVVQKERLERMYALTDLLDR